MGDPLDDAALAAIEARCEAARRMLGQVCANGARFTMSIPVQEDDFDILTGRALNDSAALLAALRRERAEVAKWYEQARRNGEALRVYMDAAIQTGDKYQADIDALRAEVARLRDLCGRASGWMYGDALTPDDHPARVLRAELRDAAGAALAGEGEGE